MAHSTGYKDRLGFVKPSPKFQTNLINEILDDLNKPENTKYQDFFVNWFKPYLYTKKKYNPMLGSYKKVKIKDKLLPLETWWEKETLLKKEHLIRKIPRDGYSFMASLAGIME